MPPIEPVANDDTDLHSPTEPPRLRRSIGTTIRSTIITVAAILGAITIVIVVVCVATGVRPAIVISGSMSPTIPTGSMTFAREIPASDVRVGDIVTVDRVIGSGLVTHRVVEIDDADGGITLTLQGDANSDVDPAPYPVTSVGEVVFHVAGLGAAAAVVRTPLGITAVVLIVIAFTIFGFMPPRDGQAHPRAH